MRRVKQLLVAAIVLYLGLVVYSNRALFFSQFDQPYWQDRYEQSQWKLPISERTIGDDGLYLYEGYRLIHGADPTSSNAEMPPLGKYLIGLSLVTFQNGHVYGFIITTALIAATAVLAMILFHSGISTLIISLLLASDPLITAQYTLTMMDSLQALFLVVYLIVLFKIPSTSATSRPRAILFAGIALGLFAETKVALLAPLLACVGFILLWRQDHKWKNLFIFIGSAIAGYVLPYSVYFFRHPSVIDWLRIQKWIIAFYLHGNIQSTWGSVISTLMVGKYQNIFSRGWASVPEWSPTWGMLSISTLAMLVQWKQIRQHRLLWMCIVISLFGIISIYNVIPFWTRYLVPALPLLYISGYVWISKRTKYMRIFLITLLLGANLLSTKPILFPTPQQTVKQFMYNTERLFFSDLYQDTTRTFQKTISRKNFNSFGLNSFADGEIERVTVTPIGGLPHGHNSPQYLHAKFSFATRRLGVFTTTAFIPFVLEDNTWKIPWQWSLLIPGMTISTRMETTVIPAHRGAILASDKKPLASDVNGVIIWITPARILPSEEDALLTKLETAFHGDLPSVAIHQRIVANTLPMRAIPIGVLPYDLDSPDARLLQRFQGVSYTPSFAREVHPNNFTKIGTIKNTQYTECCSLLYSTTTYDGIDGVEREKNSLLKGINGGTLVLKNFEGIAVSTLIQATKQDGKDVQP